jgi:periplasmic divalent cation tolerance protein
MVMTTVDDEAAATALAHGLVEAGLAACVQLLPIRSVFRWEGAVTETGELLLLVKTRTDRYAAVESFLAERHGYDVPEIVRVPITAGLAPYLAWVDEVTGG